MQPLYDDANRAQGALIGLAVGDAIGTTVEFQARGSFEPLTDMVGGGPFRLKPGQYTDDTSMALCLAASLIEKNDFSLRDQMARYVRWNDSGYMSSTGRCFDIGVGTSKALNRFRRTGEAEAGDTSPSSAGNGCLMRLAPVPIRYSNDMAAAVTYSEAQARGTHQAAECTTASRVFGEMLVRALNGASKQEILMPPVHTDHLPAKLHAVVVGASWAKKPRNAIKGSGYVIDALEAALWAFAGTNTFRDCVLCAANLGDDADTTAAIAGQLAGAHYGLSGIPPEWQARLQDFGSIREMASQLLQLQRQDAAA